MPRSPRAGVRRARARARRQLGVAGAFSPCTARASATASRAMLRDGTQCLPMPGRARRCRRSTCRRQERRRRRPRAAGRVGRGHARPRRRDGPTRVRRRRKVPSSATRSARCCRPAPPAGPAASSRTAHDHRRRVRRTPCRRRHGERRPHRAAASRAAATSRRTTRAGTRRRRRSGASMRAAVARRCRGRVVLRRSVDFRDVVTANCLAFQYGPTSSHGSESAARRRLHLRGRRLRHLRPARSSPPPSACGPSNTTPTVRTPRPAAQRRQRGVPDAGQPVRPRDVRGGRGGVRLFQQVALEQSSFVNQEDQWKMRPMPMALLLVGPAAVQHRQRRPPRRARHRGHVRPHAGSRRTAQRHVPRPREARDAAPACAGVASDPNAYLSFGTGLAAKCEVPLSRLGRHRAAFYDLYLQVEGEKLYPVPTRVINLRVGGARVGRQRGVVARRPRERPARPPLLRRRRPERPQGRRERADGGALPVGGDADGEDAEGPAEPDLRAGPRAPEYAEVRVATGADGAPAASSSFRCARRSSRCTRWTSIGRTRR